ncbi:MAG: hypothetical protein LC652_05375 [Halomonas sp.]|nr:hypothetical protein [Halomonas sp.]
MPRNSWMSLLEEEPPHAGAVDPQSAGEVGSSALSLPPELATLQAERIALEERMAALSGRSSEPTGETRRFPVTPLGERRQADEAWARRRDVNDLRQLDSSWRHAGVPVRQGGAAESDQAVDSEPVPTLRTGQRLIRRLALRDRLQASAGRTGLSSDEPDDGPRRPPVSAVERLRERWDEGPSLPDRWQATRDALSTRVERYYTERRDRLLSVVTGGSGDLDTRAEQARDRALEARRLERQRQQADDERVQRSRQRSRFLPGDSP